MTKIKCHGAVEIPTQVRSNANAIRFENYKVNTPAKFQIRQVELSDTLLIQRIGRLTGVAEDKLDFVYFSVCKGAEPHVDKLDPAKFEPRTFVIPIILPNGKSIITAEDEEAEVKLNHIYEFNHEKIHSMELEDNESGCVVIMIAVKRI